MSMSFTHDGMAKCLALADVDLDNHLAALRYLDQMKWTKVPTIRSLEMVNMLDRAKEYRAEHSTVRPRRVECAGADQINAAPAAKQQEQAMKFRKGDTVSVSGTVEFGGVDYVRVKFEEAYTTVTFQPKEVTMVLPSFEVGDRVSVLSRDRQTRVHGNILALAVEHAWIDCGGAFVTAKFDHLSRIEEPQAEEVDSTTTLVTPPEAPIGAPALDDMPF